MVVHLEEQTRVKTHEHLSMTDGAHQAGAACTWGAMGAGTRARDREAHNCRPHKENVILRSGFFQASSLAADDGPEQCG